MLLFGVCLGILGGASAARAVRAESQAVAAATPTATATVGVGFQKIDPLIPDGKADSPFTISGILQNTTQASAADVTVKLGISSLVGRDNMQATPSEANDRSVSNPDPAQQKSFTLAGTPHPWSYSFPKIATMLGTYFVARPGVYALDVAVYDDAGKQLGITRGYLTWKPLDEKSAAFKVALLWPVTDRPEIDDIVGANQVPELADAGLAQDISPTVSPTSGRLTNLLASAAGLKVNWVVDPDLLYAVSAMGNGYQTRTAQGKAPDLSNGAQTQAATVWTADAKNAMANQSCWRLPYADPDLASLAHATAADGVALLNLAAATTAPPNANVACQASHGLLAWPAAGRADAATVGLVSSSVLKPSATVLSGLSVASNGVPGLPTTGKYTPTGRGLVLGKAGATVNAVISDKNLDADFTDAAQNADRYSTPGLLAGQRWLADTALVARDGTGPTLVAAPPRDFDPTPGLVAALKAGADQGKWYSLVDLGPLIAEPPVAGAARLAAQPIAENDPAAGSDLTPAQVTDAVMASSNLAAFEAIRAQKSSDDTIAPLRTVATYWRHADAGQQTVYAGIVDSYADSLHKAVLILTPRTLTVSGKSGTFPVSIVNNSPYPVQVKLRLSANNLTNRLKIPGTGTLDVPVISSMGQVKVDVPFRATGSGQAVRVDLALLIPATGQLYAPSTDTHMLVQVNEVGLIALGLMIGSATLLVVAIGLRVYRSNRAHHAAGQDTMAS